MQASNPSESPIINNPIINSPIVNNPIISSPISTSDEEVYEDFNCACSAAVPAGSRVFYFKLVTIMFGILIPVLYGVFKLCEKMGWL